MAVSDTKPTYWLALFTVTSWTECLAIGGNIIGFNDNRWGTAQKIQPGDKILCYLTKVSAFVAVLEVTEPAFQSSEQIWQESLFPVRIGVTTVTRVPTAHAIQITSLRDRLSIFKGLKHPNAWSIRVRSAPTRWQTRDGEVIERELSSREQAGDNYPARPGSPPVAVSGNSLAEQPARAPRSSQGKTVVARIIDKTNAIAADYNETLGPRESVLSGNRVTGYSVNFPISETCKPTRVCVSTCYFATGYNAWSNALRSQLRNLAAVRQDHQGFADRVALEYDKLELSFLRWNGGGDLFPESVKAINYLSNTRPDLRLWVVTRLPEYAALIEQSPHVFIHFSLDRHSLKRREEFESLTKLSDNYYYSYQAEPGEIPTVSDLTGTSVLFFDSYDLPDDYSHIAADLVCPLNETSDITDTCEQCRRCFNGTASEHRRGT